MKRREFLKRSAVFSSTLCLPGFIGHSRDLQDTVVKVSGESPYQLTQRAIKELGGMKKFISPQDVVIIKPNIGWNRTVEQAANTNPEVVRALIEMIYDAKAKKVIVMDNSCHKSEDTYRRSGIADAAKKAGADVRFVDENRLVVFDFKGSKLKRWPVFKDFFEADKFVNVPILKHHGSSVLTIGMKNLYGIIGGRRGKLHRDMAENISDLARGFKTDLTVVDAYRVLLRNGPIGGRLSDVELKKTIIASANIMEADVVAADLFGKVPQEVPFIQKAFEKKLGQIDLAKIKLKTFAV